MTKKLSSILPFYSESKIGGLRNCKAAKSDSVDFDSTWQFTVLKSEILKNSVSCYLDQKDRAPMSKKSEIMYL